LEYDCTTRVRTAYDVATRVGTSHVSTTRLGTIRVSATRVGILMTSDLRLIETACIHCLYKPVFGTELGKSCSVAFNSQTILPKLVFTDCWDLANPNTKYSRIYFALAATIFYRSLGIEILVAAQGGSFSSEPGFMMSIFDLPVNWRS
jgi:hypothetical protein